MYPEPMAVTGERTVPGVWHENYWFRRHEVVYVAIAEHAAGLNVLDAGCGEGYGAGRLERRANRVCAVDYDANATTHVRHAYPRLDVVRANLVALPFAAGSFDLVVSAQTIEHLWDQNAFVAECARVLRPGGYLVLSTPNTLTFPPGNPFHSHELKPGDLVDLAGRHLAVESVRGLHHAAGLASWEVTHGSIVDAQIATAYGGWPAVIRRRVTAIRCDDFELREPASHDCLDTVVVARHSRAYARAISS